MKLEKSENPWKKFVFLPAYKATALHTSKFEDCVYRTQVADMGYVTSNDIYALVKYFRFTPTHIDFHTPAEHYFNLEGDDKGEYQLEM